MYSSIFCLLCLLLSVAYCYSIDYVARGFAAGIDFVRWEDAQALSRESGKKIMVIFSEPWCGACKQLKSALQTSTEFIEATKNFIMVNVEGLFLE